MPNCHKVLRGRCYHLHLGSKETERVGSSQSLGVQRGFGPSLSCPKVLVLKTGILISSFQTLAIITRFFFTMTY